MVPNLPDSEWKPQLPWGSVSRSVCTVSVDVAYYLLLLLNSSSLLVIHRDTVLVYIHTAIHLWYCKGIEEGHNISVITNTVSTESLGHQMHWCHRAQLLIQQTLHNGHGCSTGVTLHCLTEEYSCGCPCLLHRHCRPCAQNEVSEGNGRSAHTVCTRPRRLNKVSFP
jgi:hypothetical protein